MKKLKEILAVVVLVFCCSIVVKADTKAAQITGVKQIGHSSSSITLTCDGDVLGDTKYYVVGLSEDNSIWKDMENNYTNQNSIYLGGLNAGKTYYVHIKGASDYTMQSGKKIWNYTTEASATIEVVTAPNTNAAVVQTNATTSNVTVGISQAAGANYYQLVYNNQIIGEGDSTAITSKTLPSGVKYWTSVYPCRKANTGYIARSSAYSSLYLKTLQPKLGKNNFNITSAWLNLDSYKFEVNTSYAADGYQFQFLDVAGKVKQTMGTQFSYIYPKNLKGTFYQYRVRSYVNCGTKPVYSAWSDTRTFAFAKKATGKYVGGKLKVNWSKVKGATKYIVYTSDKENSGYKKVKTLSAKKRSITISKIKGKKLKKKKTYYIKIVPVSKKLGKADSYGVYSWKFY